MKKILIPTIMLMLLATTMTLWSTRDNPGYYGSLKPAASGEGSPSIGGSFSLIDQHGKQVNDSDFRGRMMLVFFGFTHCPDICPVTVKNLSDVMGMLADKADQVAPVFITVDPERDTPSVMASYLSSFDARMIGLTGEHDKIKSVGDAYKAYFAKSPVGGGAQDSREDDHTDMEESGMAQEDHEHNHDHGGDYTMDHSGFVYLMDREGKYVTHFPYDASPATIVSTLRPYLK